MQASSGDRQREQVKSTTLGGTAGVNPAARRACRAGQSGRHWPTSIGGHLHSSRLEFPAFAVRRVHQFVRFVIIREPGVGAVPEEFLAGEPHADDRQHRDLGQRAAVVGEIAARRPPLADGVREVLVVLAGALDGLRRAFRLRIARLARQVLLARLGEHAEPARPPDAVGDAAVGADHDAAVARRVSPCLQPLRLSAACRSRRTSTA